VFRDARTGSPVSSTPRQDSKTGTSTELGGGSPQNGVGARKSSQKGLRRAEKQECFQTRGEGDPLLELSLRARIGLTSEEVEGPHLRGLLGRLLTQNGNGARKKGGVPPRVGREQEGIFGGGFRVDRGRGKGASALGPGGPRSSSGFWVWATAGCSSGASTRSGAVAAVERIRRSSALPAGRRSERPPGRPPVAGRRRRGGGPARLGSAQGAAACAGDGATR